MDERDVAGLARFDTERNADKLRDHIVQPGGLCIDGDIAEFVDTVDPGLQRGCITDVFIELCVKGHIRRGRGICSDRCLGDGGGLFPKHLGHTFGQGAKLHLGQKAQQLICIRVAHLKILKGEVQRRVLVQLDQITGQADLVGMVDQGLAPLGLLDLARALQQRIEITIFVDQQSRSLDPDPGCPGDVIDRVARQRLHIHHTIGIDAEFLEHTVAVDALVFHRIQHFNTAADQLHQILVRTDDGAAATCGACLHGERGNDVVRLETFLFLARDVERFGGGAGQGDLRTQVFGHGLAVGFVFVIHVIAESMAALVKDHGHMGRCIRPCVAFDIAVQHVAKTRHRTNRQPVRLARQRWQRVIGAENKRRPVDQMQMVTFAKCAGHVGAPLSDKLSCATKPANSPAANCPRPASFCQINSPRSVPA